MADITLHFSKANGYLPGTVGWLKKELVKRNAKLEIKPAKGNKPAVFLVYDSMETNIPRKNHALAVASYWDDEKIETFPFPDDMGKIEVMGAVLTDAAMEIMHNLAKQAAEQLQAAMDEDDAATEETEELPHLESHYQE